MECLLVKVTPFLLLLVLTTAETYYITPSSSTPRPGEGVPCFTLSQYATKPSNYFTSNTTLILLPGNHSLDSKLSIRNITSLFIETTHSDTSITCNQSARLTFETINVVGMRGLVLFGCVNNEVTKVEQFTLEDCTFQGQGRDGTGLELNEVSTAYIMRSSFSSNTGKEIFKEIFGLHFRERRRVGGAIIIVNGTLGITISNCTFNSNTATGDGGAGGAVFVDSSHMTIVNSTLYNNTVTGDEGAGGAVFADSSNITIVNSTLNNNTVTGDEGYGGAVYADSSSITIVNSTLNNNTVTGDGGAVLADSSNITIVNSTLYNNTVTGDGGAVLADSSNITIVNSTLYNNTVTGDEGYGGAVYAGLSIITIVNSILNNNTVTGDEGYGGAVYAGLSNITIVNSILNNNTVTGEGGAVYADSGPITIVNSILNSNTGSVFYFVSVTFNSSGFLEIQSNMASTGVLYAVESTLNLSGNTTVSNNYGSLFVYSCNVTFIGYTNIMNNHYRTNTSQEGGAVTSFQSEIVFMGRTNLMYNTAIRGGAIAVNTEQTLYVWRHYRIS